jgi:ribonucleoside-diphosphate reductase alpha chain
MKINRHFTKRGLKGNIWGAVEWEWRDIEAFDRDGSPITIRFEVPKQFSSVAANIAATKYARRKDVPTEAQELFGIEGMDNGRENSFKQLAHRLALAWMNWGVKGNYFSTEDAKKYYDEMVYMLITQKAAPNSPQWFNTGIYDAYGIEKESTGYFRVNPDTGELEETGVSFEYPQPHACFIQSVDDNMFEENGIWDLMQREGKLFKFGSGSGTNFDNVRGKNEPVSGGGKSSGLLSFLRTIDRSAGSVSSGGVTRRAAKMVCLSMDHPDIEEFIQWKSIEEEKAVALINAGYNGRFDADWQDGAYATVSGQNSNNSIRITHEFMERVENDFQDNEWNLIARTDRSVWKTVEAKGLWQKINYASWRCADPGIQYDDTINEWHTTPKAGRINASNPCSEYMFLDDTACNLASINLFRFFDVYTKTFDVEGFQHAVRLWTITLEISVLMAQFPSEAIARNSYKYRTLGLGHLDGGTILMTSGIPYDSEEGRSIVGAITAIMTGTSYATSAEMAKEVGTFGDFDIHKDDMLRVIRNHRRAAYNEDTYEGLVIKPVGLDQTITPGYLLQAAQESWDNALALGEKYGYRNAQATVLAPTGTIGLLMDAACTGVEPEFSLIKFKKLVGGGYFQFVNPNISIALMNLGYNEDEIAAIVKYVEERHTIEGYILKEEHLPVFDCANKQGETGTRFIHHSGHIKMMAAAQPFLSGAISKTINMPETATVEEIADVHYQSWKLGLKAVALYRDNCKSSQPLNLKNDEKKEEEGSTEAEVIEHAFTEEINPVVTRGTRIRLPKRRVGITHEAKIAGQKIFVRTGEYEDGSLGEFFVDIDREGGTIAGLTDVLATIASIALQYGVPVKELTDAMAGHQFGPAGVVQHDNIKMASSITDFIARLLQMEYLNDYTRIQVKPEVKEVEAAPSVEKIAKAMVAKLKEEVAVATEAEEDEDFNPFAMAGTEKCGTCGGVTKPNGACRVCLDCGATTGCS